MIKVICFLCTVPLLHGQLTEKTEPSYWRFAHRDAQFVAGLNWKATQQGTESGSLWRALGETLGHVESYLVTSSSTAERFKEPGQALIIANGSFDLAQMKKAAAKEGAVASAYKGITILGPPQIEEDTMLIAFFDTNICLIGTKDAITEALERAEQPRNGPLAEKNELFGTAVDMAGLNDLFLVTNVSKSSRDNERGAYFGLNAYAAGYKLADGVQLSMHINASTDELAKNASKRLGAILAQMNAHFPGLVPTRPGLAAPVFLSNMKMAIEESDLHAWSQVTSAQMAGLRKKKDSPLVASAHVPPFTEKPSTAPKQKAQISAAASTIVPTPVAIKKPKIVRIEGLDDGLREIPYGGTGL